MLASSPTMSTSGTDHTTGTSAKMSRPSPGPIEWINVSVVYGPPDVEKKRTKTSPSVRIPRGSFCRFIQFVSKLDDERFGPLVVDRDKKLMIPLGFSDRVGLTLCNVCGRMTQTNKNNFTRTIRICDAAVIRTDLDWGRDVNPVAVSSDGNTATFEIETQQRFVPFKSCLIKNGSLHRAVGPDNLL